MMAVRAPLGLSPSINPLLSAFSPLADHVDSPRPRSATGPGSLTPTMERAPPPLHDDKLKAPLPHTITSPQDAIAPSPVASEVTNFEDVDEELGEEDTENSATSEAPASFGADQRPEVASPLRNLPQHSLTPLRLETGAVMEQQLQARLDDEIEPQSVIHAPPGFGKFPVHQMPESQELASPTSDAAVDATPQRPREPEHSRSDSNNSTASNSTVLDTAVEAKRGSKMHDHPMPPTPLQTSLPNMALHDWSRTPRAQTRQDLGSLSRPGSSLASIQEGDDTEHPSTDETGDESQLGQRFIRDAEAEISALRTALSECWTLCNTLASLSHIHRERIFNFSGRGDMQQQAWKSCWKLCQNLYTTRDENNPSHTPHGSSRSTLDLCREFCQALFEVRVRDNETADSVLRVSFELNNHLFNTHDRSLPEAFRERTLDFYITLCHRLMKQKAKMAEETDSLLRACWSLAEMLFSLRQSRQEGRPPDEELLGSAIQSCWELCDLFREGWTQIRPERGTPRPSQATFTQAYHQARRSGFPPLDENGNPKALPETPTTIFEDTVTTISPEEAPIPNILVLGAEEASRMSTLSASLASGSAQRQQSPHPPRNSHAAAALPGPANSRWPANSSNLSVPLSAVSEGGPNPLSATTVSTVRTPAEDPTLILLKALFVRAAVMTGGGGYARSSTDQDLNSLPNFVKNLPDTAFGSQPWQVGLLDNYRKAIANDSGFRNLGVAGVVGERRRLSPVDVARAVRGMTAGVYGFGWLRDLYRHVFGFYLEEALKGNDTHSSSGRRNKATPAASLVAAVMENSQSTGAGLAVSMATSQGKVSSSASVSGSGSGSVKGGNGRRTVSQ